MYCNFTKTHAFPLVFRVSSQPTCLKPLLSPNPQSGCSSFTASSNGFPLKPHKNLHTIRPIQISIYKTLGKPTCFRPLLSQNFQSGCSSFRASSNGFATKIQKKFHAVRHVKVSFYQTLENTKSRPGGFRLIRARSYSNSYSEKIDGGGNLGRGGEKLPWLAVKKAKESKRAEKMMADKTSTTIWEDSANDFGLESGNSTTEGKESRKYNDSENRRNGYKGSTNRSVQMLENRRNGFKESRNRSVEMVENRRNGYKGGRAGSVEMVGNRRNGYNNSRNSSVDITKTWRKGYQESRNGSVNVVEIRENGYEEIDEREEGFEEEEEGGAVEIVDDPRWDKIKNSYRKIIDEKPGFERPEYQRWNKQENWGRKTWQEATESSVPRMVGEGIYGVGPVLAALSAGRREFYVLYVQEGLDLSSNNRKKKDKKGFVRVLKMAEKIGLAIKEISKHDLNMVVENRPHQGLVLDASPLEMVNVKELEPVSTKETNSPLWVALDEVTDPHNLGAIIRSAYFFGASGVVLCAKNSAPLSGVVSKASAGSLELMELMCCKNMMQFLTSSAENGWRVLGGSVSSKAVSLNQVLAGPPTILVLGSEGTGLRPLVERSCTQLVRISGNIPVDVSVGVEDFETEKMDSMGSGEEFRAFLAVESLNVSVAAGVLLHHLIGHNSDKNSELGGKQIDVLE